MGAEERWTTSSPNDLIWSMSASACMAFLRELWRHIQRRHSFPPLRGKPRGAWLWLVRKRILWYGSWQGFPFFGFSMSVMIPTRGHIGFDRCNVSCNLVRNCISIANIVCRIDIFSFVMPGVKLAVVSVCGCVAQRAKSFGTGTGSMCSGSTRT